MSEGGDRLEKPFHESILQDQNAKDCMQPMGQTSENVGRDFDISREAQDRFAAESYQRAERAQKAGWFDEEIVPFKTKIKDPKSGEEKEITLTKDEGPRYGTTFELLSKIRPAFPAYGDKSTGGNSSQVTDGGLYCILTVTRNLADSVCSCCHFIDETLKGDRNEPAYPGQVLRRDSRRCGTKDNGNWSLPRNPEAAW